MMIEMRVAIGPKNWHPQWDVDEKANAYGGQAREFRCIMDAFVHPSDQRNHERPADQISSEK